MSCCKFPAVLLLAIHALAMLNAGTFPPLYITPFLVNDLHELIYPHNVIPYSSSSLDAADALKVTDEDLNDPGQIFDIYRSTTVGANQFIGSPDNDQTILGWNREHVWPSSLGIGTSGADYSDLYNLRVCNARINSARRNRQFSTCSSGCLSPAQTPSIAAAPDTAEGSNQWLAPASVRGNIARAMMYMVIRYDGADSSTTDLQFGSGAVADLATMLQWHQRDPVDDYEPGRVQKTCEQFNRNSFVDFPELVEIIFGSGMSTGSPTTGTGFPTTASPSQQQTQSPSTLPITPSPTPLCADMVITNIFYQDGQMAPCSDIDAYCSIYNFVREHCPATCGSTCNGNQLSVASQTLEPLPDNTLIYALSGVAASGVAMVLVPGMLWHRGRQVQGGPEPTRPIMRIQFETVEEDVTSQVHNPTFKPINN